MENNPLRVYNNVIEMIGSTPLLRLNTVPKDHGVKCNIFGKLEGYNPGGSIKDRIGLNMIRDKEKKKEIKKGDVVVECSSGNTAMGLALVSALRGYGCIITIPDKMSIMKVNRLKAIGAEVHVCPTDACSKDPENYHNKAHHIGDKLNHHFIN